MKAKKKSPIVDAFYYDGQYQSYLDIFNAIKALSKSSTLTTWERNVPIYYFNPFLNQKIRFVEGDYVVIEKSRWEAGDILISSVHKEDFEENYEIME